MIPYGADSPEENLKRLMARFSLPQGAPPESLPETVPGGHSPMATGISSPATAVTPVGPKVPSAAAGRQATDEAELSRLQQTGSGVDQYRHQHPILGTIAKVGDIALSSLFPSVAGMVPGTQLHHQELVNQQEGRVAEDVGQQAKEATTANTAATTAHTQQETTDLQNKPDNPLKDAFQLWMQQNPGHPVSEWFKTQMDAKPPGKPDSLDQQYNDAIQRGDHQEATRLLKVKADLARAGQAPDRPEKTPHEIYVTPEGKVVELRPGDTVPAGSKTASSYGKPSADEQRRADLAGNLKENLAKLEEIANRRPDLFGPAAGRWTELKSAIGTGDADIATLNTIKHQIGMAQISAHGMRSAHGIDSAAESILNSFHNTPQAVLGAVKAARDSVGTFEQDVENAKGAKPAQQGGPAIGSIEDGHRFKGGNPADPNSWEKVKK